VLERIPLETDKMHPNCGASLISLLTFECVKVDLERDELRFYRFQTVCDCRVISLYIAKAYNEINDSSLVYPNVQVSLQFGELISRSNELHADHEDSPNVIASRRQSYIFTSEKRDR
jgi:hypothetical protein